MRTLTPNTQVMNIHIIGSGEKKKKKKIVSDWLYANEFVLGVRNCGGKNIFAGGEVWCPKLEAQTPSRSNIKSGKKSSEVCFQIIHFIKSSFVYIDQAYILCNSNFITHQKASLMVSNRWRNESCSPPFTELYRVHQKERNTCDL